MGSFFFSGSVALERVTPLFLAVTRLSFFLSCCLTFSILLRKGMVSYAAANDSPNEVSSVRYRATRASMTWYDLV